MRTPPKPGTYILQVFGAHGIAVVKPCLHESQWYSSVGHHLSCHLKHPPRPKFRQRSLNAFTFPRYQDNQQRPRTVQGSFRNFPQGPMPYVRQRSRDPKACCRVHRHRVRTFEAHLNSYSCAFVGALCPRSEGLEILLCSRHQSSPFQRIVMIGLIECARALYHQIAIGPEITPGSRYVR